MKILYVTTVSDTMGFFVPHIKMLLKEGHNVDIACNIGKPIPAELLSMGCKAYNIEFQRSPLKKDNFKAYKSLKMLILTKEYDAVHTHTPIASVITRLACKNLDNLRVIYTAHGFHFYKGGPILNWLIYFPIEKWLAKYTDTLLTINKEDYTIALKHFKAKEIQYIPGVGINTKNFNQVEINRNLKRKELNIPEDAFVLLSIGELNKNKNHETVIKALQKLGKTNIYYLICGVGPLESHLNNIIVNSSLENRVSLLGFQQNVAEFFMISDIFIFPSYREGLSVALMEAMACGLPVICSNIRGNIDLIENNSGGYLVNPKDVNDFVQAIDAAVRNSNLRKSFGSNNKKNVEFFDMKNVLNDLKELY